MSDVTQLLDAAASGDRKAAESPDHTLDGTALVHEAYLRLIGDQEFDHRGHFFAAAAEAMRRILIEAARREHFADAQQNRPITTGQPKHWRTSRQCHRDVTN